MCGKEVEHVAHFVQFYLEVKNDLQRVVSCFTLLYFLNIIFLLPDHETSIFQFFFFGLSTFMCVSSSFVKQKGSCKTSCEASCEILLHLFDEK